MAPRFNLQNVLDIRHSKVEALEIELSELMIQQQQAEEALNSLQQQRMGLMLRLSQAQIGELDLVEINLLHANMVQIGEQIIVATDKLRKAEQAVERKRKELVQARQDEETLEILKRKRIEAYNQEQAQSEARTQDDIYISQAFQQRQANLEG